MGTALEPLELVVEGRMLHKWTTLHIPYLLVRQQSFISVAGSISNKHPCRELFLPNTKKISVFPLPLY